MELYGFMEREKKIPSYFFIITNLLERKLDSNSIRHKQKYIDNITPTSHTFKNTIFPNSILLQG